MCVYIYKVEVKSLHTPCRICKMLIILPSKRDHNSLHFVFSTDLNKICHIKDVYMRENNSLIYKNYPVQKFTYA